MGGPLSAAADLIIAEEEPPFEMFWYLGPRLGAARVGLYKAVYLLQGWGRSWIRSPPPPPHPSCARMSHGPLAHCHGVDLTTNLLARLFSSVSKKT